MHRFYFVLLLLGFFYASSNAQSALRKKIQFDEDWRFSFGHAASAEKDFNYGIANLFSKTGKAVNTAIDPGFDDKQWRKLNLPHDWAVELPFVNSHNEDIMAHGYKPVGGLFPETSIGWYRKHFTIAKADSGKRFDVQFDGIFRDANIWLNGHFLGNNKSGYLGINYDITDYINFGKDNILVVRADATQYEGWFYEGAGIYRHVWLNEYQNVHIPTDGQFIYSSLNGNKATVTVETEVENKGLLSSGNTVICYITDRNGKKLSQSVETAITLQVNEQKTVRQTLSVSNAHLWSLDDPYLYKIVSVVKNQGKIIDTLKSRFGIRTIKIDPKEGFFLNGKHIKIQGTNNHQDHAGVGSAVPDELQYYRINLLKELGANAYRTSHHAPAAELLEACDSLGMLVLEEQRLLNSSPEYADQFKRLIKRDRNHPSVILWSIGNEEGYVQTTSVGKRIAQSLLAIQKQLDPTRTSTYAADLANVYNGVNEVIPVRGFNYRQFAVADYHRDHPRQPIIGTEMGSTVTTRGIYEKDSIRAYVPDQDITAPWWASRAEEWWKLAAVNPYWLGGFVWTGFDYRGEPTPYQWPNISSHFGIMDVCGFPKNIYYYYQSWWTNKDVLHISPHWNWKGKEGKSIDVWVNSNAETVELFLNGSSLGKKEMPRNSHLNWTVNYQPGTLEAVAFKNERRISAKIETTGEAAELKLVPHKTSMKADGQDVVVINVSVLDKKGREVPDAANKITFSLSGNAKIIGVGNGDPSSHEPDKGENGKWQRSLFNGKCQIIIQPDKNPGTIKIEAGADNLKNAHLNISAL